jgi:tRNA (guanosine-2'-O-)-methyltransferase
LEKELERYLTTFLTPQRLENLLFALNNRTKYIALVLEDLYNPLNANAVIRNADCFGIQDIHIIENRNLFYLNHKTNKGTAKWTNLYRYSNLDNTDCLATLKSKNYSIVATSPHATNTVADLDFSRPLAFVFGNERDGVSPATMNKADQLVKIQMYGFAESFNISVSTALIMQQAREQLEQKAILWSLSEKEKQHLYQDWLMKSVNRAEDLAKFWKNNLKEPR